MFEMDERLVNDTVPLGKMKLCHILLMNDSRYPWLVLVPRCSGISEVFDLTAEQQQQLWLETSAVGRVLKDVYQADKINIATLGNVVSQLHMHVVVRMQDDAAWPAPVWGRGETQAYSAEAIVQISERLRSALVQYGLIDAEVNV